MIGGDGNDSISGGDGDDIFTGGIGNDTLDGGAGADNLTGGVGNDTLNGGLGNDVYLFARGDGQDTINEANDSTPTNNDVVQLTNIKSSEVTAVERSGYNGADLVLKFGSDQVTIRNYFSKGYTYLNGKYTEGYFSSIEQFKFADGVIWTMADIASRQNGSASNDNLSGFSTLANTLNGMGGNDYLFGADLDDSLAGGTGNDYLQGGKGNDTYLFGIGDGQDRISDYDATTGNQDILQLGAGLDIDEIWLRKVGNDLEVSVVGSTDKISIANWYSGGVHQVEKIRTTGGNALLASQVDALVSAMAAFDVPPMGSSKIPDAVKNQLAPVLASSWA